MKKSFFLLGLVSLAYSQVGRADIFDRINVCESQGGGACVFNLMRELAASATAAPSFLNGGTYVTESWSMTVVVSGTTVTIIDPVTYDQAGQYHCTGLVCNGPKYNLTVVTPDQVYMSYGRTWNRRTN